MAGASRGDLPGILTLLGLFEEHRPAFEYDWRTRFHLSLNDVGEAMTWGEAMRHTITLSADTASHVGAAVNGMQFPASREYLALQRLNANFVSRYTDKRAKFVGLPDPFEVPTAKHYGGSPMSKAALDAILASHRAQPAVEQEATIV